MKTKQNPINEDEERKLVNWIQRNKATTITVTVITLLLLDIITKAIAFATLRNADDVVIIDNVFRFRFVWNTGSAFGLLNINRYGFLFVNLFIFIAFGYFFFVREDNYRQQMLFSILTVGGFGNVLDRFIYTHDHAGGAVVDFISFGNFPVFNMADIYVVVAAILLVVDIWKDDYVKKKIQKFD